MVLLCLDLKRHGIAFTPNPFAGQYTRLLKERGGENAPGFHNPGARRFWKYKLFSISLKPSIQ